MTRCFHPNCTRQSAARCECCREETPFCEDHGTVGGDRSGEDTVAAYAVPSACWKCGGFNADA